MSAPLYRSVLEELPQLISDNDLHISQLVLTLLCTVMDVSPNSIVEVWIYRIYTSTVVTQLTYRHIDTVRRMLYSRLS